MAHRRMFVDRVLVVAWRAPVAADIREISADLVARRAQLGRPLLYQSVIGQGGIPTGAVREMIADFYKVLLANCSSIHVVIEGSEFEQSIKRSVIAAMTLQHDTRGRVFVGNSLERVHDMSPAEVRQELVRAARVADEGRLFDFARAADGVADVR